MIKKTTIAVLIQAICAQSAVASSIFDDSSSSSSSSSSESVSYFDFTNKETTPDIWQYDGAQPWKAKNVYHSSNKALRSPPLAVGQTATLTTSFISEGGQISFDLKVIGAKSNRFSFYINDVLQVSYFLPIQEYKRSFDLPESGEVTVKWVFDKKYASANNKDFLWLDNITIDGDMDTDLDGFNDAWELKYFHDLSTINLSDKTLDYDQDNLTNFYEYQHHTDPTQPDSAEVEAEVNAKVEIDEEYETPALLEMGMSSLKRGELERGYDLIARAANERAYPPAMHQLGVMYETGLYVTQDLSTAVQWYTEAANKDHPAAQVALSECYRTGNGVYRNVGAAFYWLKKAADLGYSGAYFKIGQAYDHALGVTQNDAQANMYYKKAVAAKSKSYELALYNLGVNYKYGYGTSKNLYQAFRYFKQAADLGYGNAYFKIGYAYDESQGVTQDYEQANIYYKKAVAAKSESYELALYNLGVNYKYGYGTKNLYQAFRYFKQAADLGYGDALNEIKKSWTIPYRNQ
jgi:TPR repeat protein